MLSYICIMLGSTSHLVMKLVQVLILLVFYYIIIFNIPCYCCCFSQGLKRLKKHQPSGECGHALLLGCTTAENFGQDSRFSATHTKEAYDSTSRDRYPKGVPVPISVKSKKMAHEEAINSHIGTQKDDRFRSEIVKPAREPPSVEMVPKRRLKIRGPTFWGLESRLR